MLPVVSQDVSEQAHAAILLRVAAKAVVEARHAWQRARPADADAASLRSAFRACVLAVRSVRSAAAAWAHDARESKRIAAQTGRLVAAAGDLKARLARAQQESATG